jgi:hypothetical protein
VNYRSALVYVCIYFFHTWGANLHVSGPLSLIFLTHGGVVPPFDNSGDVVDPSGKRSRGPKISRFHCHTNLLDPLFSLSC